MIYARNTVRNDLYYFDESLLGTNLLQVFYYEYDKQELLLISLVADDVLDAYIYSHLDNNHELIPDTNIRLQFLATYVRLDPWCYAPDGSLMQSGAIYDEDGNISR